ncbi:anti-sigma-B factor antagonist [bacterium BMS3Abin05]|nr:anti-sigma-B factor antagonist [bacterium BMS3Abin05]GBE27525.1 anti-sigma-B factor antagonist [bacterium BMS3Bbin03]HDK36567.1 anti-sigma factor antagonist [Bacteroidota bacterium]HDZ11426.1 anti-sigma factor antagonist [Bacteroidota bacterium]
MKLITEQFESIVVCRPEESKIDASNAADLKKEFLRVFLEESPHVILDLGGVTDIDSTGLGAILFGLRNVKNYNGEIKIVNPQPRVQRLIDIAQLGRLLNVYKSVGQALQDFNRGDGNQI